MLNNTYIYFYSWANRSKKRIQIG